MTMPEIADMYGITCRTSTSCGPDGVCRVSVAPVSTSSERATSREITTPSPLSIRGSSERSTARDRSSPRSVG
ncbi:Uncharacterised protein [Mycobacteroides abscessus subsp. abscessus]|nr:Uncharacterised protein [Mycobacteroides abscessus subsp. abscessus]